MTFLAPRFIVALLLSLPGALVMAACAVSGGPVLPAQTNVTPTPALPPQGGGGSDWVLLDKVLPGSPQIEYGPRRITVVERHTAACRRSLSRGFSCWSAACSGAAGQGAKCVQVSLAESAPLNRHARVLLSGIQTHDWRV